ncbi:haloacid dehalogenase-like hydrolase [Treponema phagedenis]|uniref:haloacid dehalogenase-like hydrolase n=1 Tax=Treponema phagedenis TaxID=162 RepID=UPI0004648FED|nr:haloacid dehalogenase-like hydrolase [Treponema phagedenis]
MSESILQDGRWNAQSKRMLEKLIKESAFSNNYAVFDWDDTCIFSDTQNNLFLYQIEHLIFNVTPASFSDIIRTGVPQNEVLPNVCNVAGEPLTAKMLSEDLDKSYKFLYNTYEGFKGRMSLKEIKATDEFCDFKAKLMFLTGGLFYFCGVDLSQATATGMTLDELALIAERSIDWGLNAPISYPAIESPASLRGKAGVVRTSFQTGLRVQSEMQNLISVLNANGIETYVCSASHESCIRVFATNEKYGYCIKNENIFARKKLLDENGKLTHHQDMSVPSTWREGKALAIKTQMAPLHENKAPILIAGDSDGDFYMMNEYKHNALLLIFDCNRSTDSKIRTLIRDAEKNNHILVQKRNPQTGYMEN